MGLRIEQRRASLDCSSGDVVRLARNGPCIETHTGVPGVPTPPVMPPQGEVATRVARMVSKSSMKLNVALAGSKTKSAFGLCSAR
jgi:hypothetical protein